MDKPNRTEPYVAPGAPRSPRVVAIASAIVAVAALAANLLELELHLDLEIVLAVVGGVYAVIGGLQDRAARGEQAAGVAKLAEARAELPPGAVAGDSMADRTTEANTAEILE